MLELKLESASYSELDFPVYNGAGFAAVQQAVAVAQQARALAHTPEELQKAAWLMRAAADRKNHEQEIAMRTFEQARQKAFEVLRKAMDVVREGKLWGPQRLELENRADHLVTSFGLKNFSEVERGASQIIARLSAPRPVTRNPAPRPTPVFQAARTPTYSEPRSASSWFELGRTLERKGRSAQAIEAYQQALRMNPRHFQAENQLSRLTASGKRRVS